MPWTGPWTAGERSRVCEIHSASIIAFFFFYCNKSLRLAFLALSDNSLAWVPSQLRDYEFSTWTDVFKPIQTAVDISKGDPAENVAELEKPLKGVLN